MIKSALLVRLSCAFASLWVASLAHGDALVVTQAMKASTIAEIFVEDDAVRVEIEVGGGDIDAFKNLLPDKLFQKISGESRPLGERVQAFLRDDWKVVADDQQLVGEVENIELTKRIMRDEITGQPLANQPEDAEIVLSVKLRYPCVTKPKLLSVTPPVGENGRSEANIGFVVYHRGVAVNDFRYLSGGERLRLDWADPWYSAFEQKTLRRRYFAPAAAFLYVENFEVRKEIVFRPKDLQEWIDLGLAGKQTIKASQRDLICKTAAEFLARHTPLEIDGRPSEGTLDRVHFIQRSLKTAGVVQPDEDIDIDTAMIGAIYVYPRASLPETVKMQWDLFNDRIQAVPTVATDEAGGLPGALSPDDSSLEWENFLKNPTVPAFLEVSAPRRRRVLPVSLISLACLASVILIWIRRRTQGQANASSLMRPSVFTILLFAVAVGACYWPRFRLEIPLSRQHAVSDSDAHDITYGLLHNVYRAFDYRDESTIYDVLSRSASGDLLTRIYLETRQSLTLASQGGARVKVQDVELVSCIPKGIQSDTFIAQCIWTVTGSVGHWGHVHQRVNQYNGEFKIRTTDGQWKLTAMELLSEERI